MSTPNPVIASSASVSTNPITVAETAVKADVAQVEATVKTDVAKIEAFFTKYLPYVYGFLAGVAVTVGLRLILKA